MTRAARLAALAGAAVLAAPLAACGSDQKFIDKYNSATKPLRSLGTDIGSSVNNAGSQSNTKLSAQFKRLADRTGEVNKNLAGLDAPGDAKKPFVDLKTALRKGEADLRDVASAAKTGNVKKAQSAVTSLSQDSQAISSAESLVKKKVEN